jgi:pimeloyl-ACP methyl ester carboxylesterase
VRRNVVRAPRESIVNSNLSENLSSSEAPQIEELFAEVDGARMRYLRAGSGPALILVHGLMGYSFSWRYTIPVLSRYATVYAIDQLGTGFSDRPVNLDCRLLSIAERFLRFLEAVGVSSFDLLGTSHGGEVSMMAASLCLQRSDLHLRKLILVAPVNPWSPHGQTYAPMLGSPIGSAILLQLIGRMQWAYPFLLARLYGDAKRIPPGTLEGYTAPVRLPRSFEYAVSIASHWTEDLQRLKSVIPTLGEIPTLLIWGEADRAVCVESAENLRSCFKNCELVVFPGIGHLTYEEAPDDFNKALIKFLTTPRAGDHNHR